MKFAEVSYAAVGFFAVDRADAHLPYRSTGRNAGEPGRTFRYAPFQAASYLGGRSGLRGWDSERFTGDGGGTWFAFVDRANTISLAMAHSEERNAFYVSVGFTY